MAKAMTSKDNKLTAEVRVQIDGRLAALLAQECESLRKKPAQIITEALTARYDFLPRLEAAIEAVENVYDDKKAIALIADQIADGFVAMADNEQLRQDNELIRVNDSLREELGKLQRENDSLRARAVR